MSLADERAMEMRQQSIPLRQQVSTDSAGSQNEARQHDAIEMDRQWWPIFDKYDHDHDGWIPLEELRHLLKEGNTDLNHDFPPEVVDEILEWADVNKDQKLSYKEFLRMVHAHELGEARPHFQRLIRYAALAVVPRNERATTVRHYIEQYSCLPPPIFLLIISLVEFIVYIYYCVKLEEFSASGPVPLHSPLIYNPYRRREAWRYLTYMLIHAGAVHIFFNLLIQLLLGIPLEMVHKWWRVGIVYITGVLAGSLGASISDPKTFVAGASGGVYSLIAAHLANVIINFHEMEFAWIRLSALGIFAGMDVGVAVYQRYSANEEDRTSYAAHFAGALAGLLIGVNCLHNLRVKSWEKKVGWVMLAIYVVLMLFAILWNSLYTDYFFPEKYD